MTSQTEAVRTREGNATFKNNFIVSLQKAVRDIPNLSVLDYGAGKDELRATTPFSNLKHRQVTFAYEPSLDRDSEYTLHEGNRTIWTKDKPRSQEFDLVVCNFSLHHMEDPLKTLAELQNYKPEFIAVSEYDFTKVTLDEFRFGFVSDAEQQELNTQFDGNWEMCFDFHQRLGEEGVRESLEQGGFSILKHQRGEGAAQNKFFMIGWTGKAA
jgi:hypothetical protein